jgi:hypothetical protein
MALSIKIKNSSKHIIAVPPNYRVPHEAPECTVELRDGQGRTHTIDYRPMFITAVLLPIPINAGATKEWTVPVDLKSDVYEPGDYTLKVTQVFTTSKIFDAQGGLIGRYPRFDEKLVSNLLNFQVKSLPLLPPGEAAKITLVGWSPESEKPSESFAARVGSLKDKLLRAEDLLGLMTNITLNPGAFFLRLKAVKDEKSTGVCLTLTLGVSKQAASRAHMFSAWQLKEHVQLGPQIIHDISGNENAGAYPAAVMGDFIGAFQKLTEAAPETPFEIIMEIRAGGAR